MERYILTPHIPVADEGKKPFFSLIKLKSWILLVIGFILSPLTWWNDLFVNMPLAYLFAIPFSLINKKLFLLFFIVGYLLTNILGFVLIHKGFRGLRGNHVTFKQELKRDALISIIYIILVIVLYKLGWLIPLYPTT